MPFSFHLSDELKEKIAVLAKKDKKTAEILNKEIKQIVNSDEITIDHFKNLQYGLKEYKRVHIAGCFVLLFKVFKKEKFILFDKLGHHDDIYKR